MGRAEFQMPGAKSRRREDLRRPWELGPEEKVPRRDREYGSDGILAMEVCMSGSQQEEDCHSDSLIEKTRTRGLFIELWAE